MANSKAKDLVPVIDSHGGFSHRRRAWVAKHEAKGSGRWEARTFRFFTEEELASRRASTRPASREPEARAAALFGHHGHTVRLRPEEPTPGSGGGFLPYPMPEGGYRGTRGLRERFPAFAREGAGLR